MATYKVLQDIEAEDKLVGPLTLRQFIYAGIALFSGFVGFKLAEANLLVGLPFFLPVVFFGLLAAPFGHDQSSEVWLLAKIRFTIKPRRRIWDQAGMKELVTVTAPKHVERNLTNGLSQVEVKSRLQALATTLDSRGWAVKNVNVNLYNEPSYVAVNTDSDRLVDAHSLPQEVPNYEVTASDDIMDEMNNPTASALDAMITQKEQDRRRNLTAVAQGLPAPAASNPTPLFAPATAADDEETEKALLAKIHAEKARPNPMNSHMKRIDPFGSSEQRAVSKEQDKPQHASTATPSNPALMQLAANDDLNISTIANEARKATQTDDDDEVVISLR